MKTSVVEHSLLKSVFLHLLPGFLTGAAYFALAPVVMKYGFPSVLALSLAGIFVLIPFELGFLFIQNRKTGQKLCNGTIPYCKSISVRQYVIWVPVVLVMSGLLFKAFDFTMEFTRPLFRWISPGLILNMGLSDDFATFKLLLTYGFFLLTIVLILPITEELYFRGYLLPRMPSGLKGWSPVIHTGLFALYHTWSPWMLFARAFGLLPLIIIVKRKENIFIGIIVHCLLNSIDFVIGVMYIFHRV